MRDSTKKKIEEMIERDVSKISSGVNFEKNHNHDGFIRRDSIECCDECGVLIDSIRAVEGEKVIRQREKVHFTRGFQQYTTMESYIHIPYYCKRCAPKKRKK